MADIKPFSAIRPQAVKAAEIAALPYDVVTKEEAREEIKKHNENRKAIILENKKQKNQLYEAWKQKVLEEIMKEGFTTKQAEHIYDFGYDEAGSIGDSTLVAIYDAVTYVVQFLNELKEG